MFGQMMALIENDEPDVGGFQRLNRGLCSLIEPRHEGHRLRQPFVVAPFSDISSSLSQNNREGLFFNDAVKGRSSQMKPEASSMASGPSSINFDSHNIACIAPHLPSRSSPLLRTIVND